MRKVGGRDARLVWYNGTLDPCVAAGYEGRVAPSFRVQIPCFRDGARFRGAASTAR